MEVLHATAAAPLPALSPGEPCVNCGTVVVAHYCPECGERRASDRDNRLSAFFAEALQIVSNLDGAFLGTLKLLLRRPGELTRLHMRGRRVGLMRPLQLFLIVNVVYFIWAGATNNQMMMTSLPNHMNRTWHSEMATAMVNRKLGDGTVDAAEYGRRLAAYRERFDTVTAVQARSLIITMVPLLAVLVGLLHLRRREFAVKHLVFSLHTYSAFLAYLILITLVVGVPAEIVDTLTSTTLMDNPVVDTAWGLTISAIFATYLYRSLRVAFGDSPRASAIGAAVLMVGMLLILFSYPHPALSHDVLGDLEERRLPFAARL